MKTFPALLLFLSGLFLVIGGAWYVQGHREIAGLKIPSVPTSSCLEHAQIKHPKPTADALAHAARAYFSGGCFWCTESDIQQVPGVLEVVSGYAGGHIENPTYRDVTSELSGHREAVMVSYDPSQTTYTDLVHAFLLHINPTDSGGQFYDRGESYQAVIFPTTPEENATVNQALRELNDAAVFDAPLTVRIQPYTNFYPAEAYHQDYAEQNALKYCAYREASGRDAFLKQNYQGKEWATLLRTPRSASSLETSQP